MELAVSGMQCLRPSAEAEDGRGQIGRFGIDTIENISGDGFYFKMLRAQLFQSSAYKPFSDHFKEFIVVQLFPSLLYVCVSCYCSSKLLQTWCLKTTQMYSSTVLEVEVHN